LVNKVTIRSIPIPQPEIGGAPSSKALTFVIFTVSFGIAFGFGNALNLKSLSLINRVNQIPNKR
jgi:hypothetical protein